MKQQTNRVKNNTYTTRADDAYALYRAEVEQKYNHWAELHPEYGVWVSFDTVLKELKKHKAHLQGEGTYLTRAQIASKLSISMPTVYRLFQLDKAPTANPFFLKEDRFYTDDVFHFIRSVYPRTAPIYHAVLLMQIEAALDEMGSYFVIGIVQWFADKNTDMVVCNV